MDIIGIEGLKIKTIIGILAHERQVSQTLILDVRMPADAKKAAQTNDLSHSVDYAGVVERIEAFARTHEHELIESFAYDLGHKIKDEFQLAWLNLSVKKPNAIAHAQSVSVTIELNDE